MYLYTKIHFDKDFGPGIIPYFLISCLFCLFIFSLDLRFVYFSLDLRFVVLKKLLCKLLRK